MNEREMAKIEAQQQCKRVRCPYCTGTGQTVVSNALLSGAGQGNVFGRAQAEQHRGSFFQIFPPIT